MLTKITPKTWVLVADGAHAKIYVGEKKGLRLRETPKETFDATQARSRELVNEPAETIRDYVLEAMRAA